MQKNTGVTVAAATKQNNNGALVMLGLACHCPCGETKFRVRRPPSARFFCHCEICQTLYGNAYADVTVIPTKDLELPDNGIEFSTFRAPPALLRGLCTHCQKPVAGLLTSIPGLKLSFISGDNYAEKSLLPAPLGHVFYHRRQTDIADALPKIRGYWRSEIQICKWLLTRSRDTASNAGQRI